MKAKLLIALLIMLCPAMLLAQIDYATSLERMGTVLSDVEPVNARVAQRIAHVMSVLEELQADPEFKTHRLLKSESANVVETIEELWDGSAWVKNAKDITTYGNDMIAALSVVTQSWNGTGWVNESRMSMPVENGHMTEMRSDSWLNGNWVTDMLVTYTYDGSGNMTVAVTQMANTPSDPLVNFAKIVNTYTGGLLTKKVNQMWNDGSSSWVNMTVTDYTYNGQGQLTEEVSSMDLGGNNLMPTSKTLYTYYASGLVHTTITQSYAFATQDWTNATKSIYQWLNDSNETKWTEYIEQTWNGTDWANTTRNAKIYNGHGFVTEDLYQNWGSGDWENYRRSLFTYNNNDLETEDLDQTWNGTAWQDVERMTSTYNNQGMPDVITFETKSGATWQYEKRWLHTYSTGSPVHDDDGMIPQRFELGNYPNPFNPVTTIRLALPMADDLSLRIFDVQGRLVRVLAENQKYQAGQYEVRWDGRNSHGHPVSSGVYIYQIEGAKFSESKRCLLVK